MMEHRPGLFGAEINGRFFRLEQIPDDNMLFLSMGINGASGNLRTELGRVWEKTFDSAHPVPVFSDHFVSILIPVEPGWVDCLKKSIAIMTKWADENDIKSGCFLCGSVDPSVYMHEAANQNTYICEACDTLLLEKEANSLRESEAGVKSGYKRENWQKYLLRVIFFRALPSFLWIPVFARILTEALPLEGDINGTAITGYMMISSPAIYILSRIALYFYGKATDEISVPGVLITSAICTVITVLEGIMAFSISRVSLLEAEGQESVNLLHVLTHLSDYFYGPITGTIGLNIIWFPLIGLIAAMAISLVNTISDHVQIEIFP